MAILRFFISPSEPCTFAIFKPTNLKFWILMKNYITTNDTSGFFDKLSNSSEIELRLGPFRIKVFFYHISSLSVRIYKFEKLMQACHLTKAVFGDKELSSENDILEKAAQILRKLANDAPKWQFQGSFDTYEDPSKLLNIFKAAIGGKITNIEKQIEIDASLLTQQFLQVCRTDRQLAFNRKSDHSYMTRETPLSVGLPLYIHSVNRSRNDIQLMSNLRLGVSYKRILEIENSLANSVEKITDATGSFSIPSCILPGQFTFFAADNIDFMEATQSGKNSLHGTVLVAYQQRTANESQSLYVNRTKKQFLSSVNTLLFSGLNSNPTAQKLEFTPDFDSECISVSNKKDMLWILSSTDIPESNQNLRCDETNSQQKSSVMKQFKTWGSFNSKITSETNQTNIGVIAPLLREPPSNYDALFTIIMRAKSVTNELLGHGNRTVVTFDLQLYNMAMKLWLSNPNIRQDFLFRPGELHILFWALSALGNFQKIFNIF
jgi:hypothetical protein